jgi:hypothetical protein
MNAIVAVRTAAVLAIPVALAAVAPTSAQDRYSYGPGPYGYGPPVYGYGPGPYAYGPPVYGYAPRFYGYRPYAYGPPVYGYVPRFYGFRGDSPEDFPVGSGAWWRAMARDGRTGRSD